MKAIKTSVGPASMKAAGMLYPKEKRLFEDPYAGNIVRKNDQKLIP